ncbi:MAG: hypothetical protein AAGI30_10790 [Planctomycetota bacterium]
MWKLVSIVVVCVPPLVLFIVLDHLSFATRFAAAFGLMLVLNVVVFACRIVASITRIPVDAEAIRVAEAGVFEPPADVAHRLAELDARIAGDELEVRQRGWYLLMTSEVWSVWGTAWEFDGGVLWGSISKVDLQNQNTGFDSWIEASSASPDLVRTYSTLTGWQGVSHDFQIVRRLNGAASPREVVESHFKLMGYEGFEPMQRDATDQTFLEFLHQIRAAQTETMLRSRDLIEGRDGHLVFRFSVLMFARAVLKMLLGFVTWLPGVRWMTRRRERWRNAELLRRAGVLVEPA